SSEPRRHAQGFSSIVGAQLVYQGHSAPDRDPNPKWSVSNLLRDITPKSMLKDLTSIFSTPQSVPRTVIHKFVGYLEVKASELIWKNCCSVTAA
ncbi:hypothetical protein BGZ97_010449, partial [Linnemannia gamsii]